METRANTLIVGIFTVVGIALAVLFALWEVRYGEKQSMRDVRVVFVGSVFGLAEGYPVYFKGIKIGEISDLTFDSQDPDLVTAMLKVDPRAPLKIDSRARIGVQGFTGTGYIEFIGGTADSLPLYEQGDLPTVVGEISPFQDIIDGAQRLLNRVEKIVERIDSVVTTNEPVVNASIANVKTFTDALANNADGLDSFLANVSKAADQLSGLTAKLDPLVGSAQNIVAAVEPERVRNVVTNVETFTTKLAESSTEFGEFVKDARKVATDLTTFSSALNATVVDINSIVGVVDREKIAKMIDNVASFSDRLKASDADFAAIVADARAATSNVNQFSATLAENRDQVGDLITNAAELSDRLNRAAQRLDGVLASADQALAGEGGQGFFAEARQAAASIREVADSFNSRADEISGGLARFSNRSVRDFEAFVQDGRRTITRLERVIGNLERDPQGFIFGKSSVPEYNPRRR